MNRLARTILAGRYLRDRLESSLIYRFGDFTLDTGIGELGRGDSVVPLEPQVFALIAYLVENRHRTVTKDELVKQIWDGRFTSDAALSSRIHAARKVLGDDGQHQALIRTLSRKGFRFVAPVVQAADPAATPDSTVPQAEHPSIAVLPFVNLSDDPHQEYFCDGVTEDVIAALSRIRQFFVIAASTMFTYKTRGVDARTVAKELGVRYVLEGSIRKDAARIRVSAMLGDGVSGRQIWAEHYDRQLDDIFAVQDQITQQVVGAIEPELNRVERERARSVLQASDLRSWDRYLQAMAVFYRGRQSANAEAFGCAIRMLELLIADDAGFSPSYGALAHSYFFLLLFNLTDDRDFARDEGLRVGLRGVEVAIDDHLCQFGLGAIYLARREPELGIEHLRAAVELNPSFGRAWSYLGSALVWSGQAKQALPVLETCLRVSPRDPIVGSSFVRCAEAHLALGDIECAHQWAVKAVQRPDAQFWANFILVSTLALLGREAQARNAFKQLLARRPDASITLFRTALPINDPALTRIYISGLERAGVPTLSS